MVPLIGSKSVLLNRSISHGRMPVQTSKPINVAYVWARSGEYVTSRRCARRITRMISALVKIWGRVRGAQRPRMWGSGTSVRGSRVAQYCANERTMARRRAQAAGPAFVCRAHSTARADVIGSLGATRSQYSPKLRSLRSNALSANPSRRRCSRYHSLPTCVWAHDYYQARKAKGHGEGAILRALAFKWIRIVARLWNDQLPYDERYYMQHRAARLVAA